MGERAPPPLIDGRYRVDELVGRGGFGAVYAGRHLVLGVKVAIKILDADPSLPEAVRADLVAAFLDEGRMLTRLRHPNVVAALDLGLLPDEGGGLAAPYLVMDWVDGRTLEAELSARASPLSVAEAWALIEPLIEAVAAAHAARIAHRDLKPGNVMITRDAGGRAVPRVIDFGVAKLWTHDEDTAGSGATRTSASRLAFTPAYAAPEQIAHARTGPWTDVHALGLIWVELLTGARPYGDGDEAQLAVVDAARPTPRAKGVDAGAFEEVIEKALALRPSNRYRSAEEMLRAAQEAAASMGMAAPSRAPSLAPAAPLTPVESRAPTPNMRTERAVETQVDPEGPTRAAPSLPPPRRRRIDVAVRALVPAVAAIALAAIVWTKQRAPAVAPVASASAPASAAARARSPKLRAVTQGASAKAVAFSPDGHALAIGERDSIRVWHDDGSPDVVLRADTIAECTPISWLPGGRSILFGRVAVDLDGKRGRAFGVPAIFSSDGARRVHWGSTTGASVFDGITETVVREVQKPEGARWLVSAAPAPADARLLLVTSDAETSRLWLVGADDTRREIARASREILPAWSRSGAVYALRGGRARALDLVRVSLDGGEPRVLVPAAAPLGSCNALSISPDGRQAAFVRITPRRQMVLLQRSGARFATRALTGEDTRVEGLSASPDGRRIAFVESPVGGRGAVQTMDLATGNVTTVGGYEGLEGSSTAWAPDGRRIAVSGPRREGGIGVSVLPVDRGIADALSVRCEEMSGEVVEVQWLDDRTLLYEGAGHDAIRAVDVESGASRAVFAPGEGWIFLETISPDRRRLAIHWNRGKGLVGQYIVRLPEGTAERVPDSTRLDFAAWEGSERALYRAAGEHDLALFAEGKLRRLDPLPLPDGSEQIEPVEGGFVVLVDRSVTDAWIAEDFDPDVEAAASRP